MIDASVMTLMGVVFTGLVTLAGAVLVFVTNAADRQSRREIAAQERKEAAAENALAQVTKLQAEQRELLAEHRDLSGRVSCLEGTVRDQAELIEDAVPLIVWIDQGAEPPVPSIGWRWVRELIKHKAHNNKDS